jgi:hypothetical protein
MPMTEDLIVSVPAQTAAWLRQLVQSRGPGSEGQIITEALGALFEEAEDNRKVSSMVAQGFESKMWHEVSDVKVAMRQRYETR